MKPLARVAFGIVTLLAVRAMADGPAEEDDEPDARAPEPAPVAPSPAPSASASSGRRVEPKQEGDMMVVEGVSFLMGSADKDAPANERPPHALAVKTFLIDRTEVTVAAYRACVAAKRCTAPAKSSALCTFEGADGEVPITCVRWLDAATYCRAQKKRLPTEAEWELAARGPSGLAYPWGTSRPTCAVANTLTRDNNPRACSGDRPARVGARPSGASPYGVLDMIGNAEEWVEDYYAEHLAHVAPRAGASHVLRGGGWLSRPSDSRATSRNWGSLVEAGPNVGFRCARDR